VDRRVRGLDWVPQEYVLAPEPGLITEAYGDLARAFNVHELRDPHGRWTRAGEGGSHVQTLAGLGQRPGAGYRPAGHPAAPSVSDLAGMVGALTDRLAQAEERARSTDVEHARALAGLRDSLRYEQKQLAAESAKVAAEGKTIADLSDDRRKEIVRSLATVLGLIAVAGLIIATAGMALPPIAAAGIAVGPLVGGELVTALHETHQHHRRVRSARG
jgi:hypothetical protein